MGGIFFVARGLLSLPSKPATALVMEDLDQGTRLLAGGVICSVSQNMNHTLLRDPVLKYMTILVGLGVHATHVRTIKGGKPGNKE